MKFADDDWLAANDLLPPTPPSTNPPSPIVTPSHLRRASLSQSADKSPFGSATIRTLRLKPITTVTTSTSCAEAIETMRDKGFDQLPVLASPSGGQSSKRLVGLVTLGNLLSWISQGRAIPSSPVADVMFSFSKLGEVVTDPRDVGPIDSSAKTHHSTKNATSLAKTGLTNGEPENPQKQKHGRKFVEITMETPLRALSRFFEWNSAAVVTERVREGEKEDEDAWMKPVAVVTKVDLLAWLVRQGRISA